MTTLPDATIESARDSLATATPGRVSLRSLRKVYGDDKKATAAVQDVDLDIEPGEFITLLGPSGCGKTTTLRMIAGFETPTAGEIRLDDDLINKVAPNKRPMAMVFQSYALFPHLSVFDNVAYGLKLKKLPSGRVAEEVETALTSMNLGPYRDRAPHQMSGGQQQRVALARALVMRPKVLLFDEPLSNLDAKLRVQMRGEIRRLQRRLGITTVFVTHDQDEAMTMSDRIVVMNVGVIEQVDTPQEIYRHPASVFVADFIGRANFLDVDVHAVTDSDADVSVLGQAMDGAQARRRGHRRFGHPHGASRVGATHGHRAGVRSAAPSGGSCRRCSTASRSSTTSRPRLAISSSPLPIRTLTRRSPPATSSTSASRPAVPGSCRSRATTRDARDE